MAEYRINSQNDTIELILKALEEVSVGIGFSVLCDIEVIKGEDSSTIIFKTKDGREIKQSDFFMLGYFVGRDFEKKECEVCKQKIENH
jgi:hypothetical protein